FFASILAEEPMKEIHHGPQMPAFLDVHLEKIAQIIKAWRGVAKQPLLFNAGRLRVALRDDDASQKISEFAGDFAPHGLSLEVAEADGGVVLWWRQENAPAI